MEGAVLLSFVGSRAEVNQIDKLVRDCGRSVYDGKRCQIRDVNRDCRFLCLYLEL